MEETTLIFTKERETKNTVQYVAWLPLQEQAEGKAPTIGKLFIQKWALGDNLPGNIIVTIPEGG